MCDSKYKLTNTNTYATQGGLRRGGLTLAPRVPVMTEDVSKSRP